MTALLVASYTITDVEGYAPYPEAVASTLLPYHGQLVAADFDSEVVEGEPRPVTVIVSFPSREAARNWYESPGYVAVRSLRQNNSEGTVVIVDGLDAPS